MNMSTCKHCGCTVYGPDSFGDYPDEARQLRCPDGRYHRSTDLPDNLIVKSNPVVVNCREG